MAGKKRRICKWWTGERQACNQNEKQRKELSTFPTLKCANWAKKPKKILFFPRKNMEIPRDLCYTSNAHYVNLFNVNRIMVDTGGRGFPWT
jgi:hypothetical protein